MGRNSFTIKAGSLTVLAALLAVSLGISSWWVAAFGTIPITMLWGLDAYFVRQERIFRRLYDTVRLRTAPDIGSTDYFAMNTEHAQSEVNGLPAVMLSRTLPFFYIPLLATLAAIAVVI